jgi:LPXTG-site transpeptidase (sortase) family protein
MNGRTPLQKFLIALNMVLVLVILGIGLDILVVQNSKSIFETKTTPIDQISVLQNNPTPAPLLPPEDLVPVEPPQHIEIPSIGLSAPIIEVGIAADKSMDVPKDTRTVGWYQYSVKPGQIGGSVFTAHYDTSTGKPAIFYNLRKMKMGDVIFIRMQNGEELLFKVDDIVSHPVAGFPTDLIFGNYTDKKLIMITCDGVWNPLERNYSKRLVVFATLWENKTL